MDVQKLNVGNRCLPLGLHRFCNVTKWPLFEQTSGYVPLSFSFQILKLVDSPVLIYDINSAGEFNIFIPNYLLKFLSFFFFWFLIPHESMTWILNIRSCKTGSEINNFSFLRYLIHLFVWLLFVPKEYVQCSFVWNWMYTINAWIWCMQQMAPWAIIICKRKEKICNKWMEFSRSGTSQRWTKNHFALISFIAIC